MRNFFVLLIFLFFASIVIADITFYDDENDFFMMSNPPGEMALEVSSPRPTANGGDSCPRGYVLSKGRCMNISFIVVNKSYEEKEEFSSSLPIKRKVPINASAAPEESATSTLLVLFVIFILLFFFVGWLLQKHCSQINTRSATP